MTCLPSVGCKESLADNLRKLNMKDQSGTKTKFVKKAYINIPYEHFVLFLLYVPSVRYRVIKRPTLCFSFSVFFVRYHLGPQFRKLNRYEPTFKRADYNIDHIFTNFEVKEIKNQMLALGRYKLSDHRLVVSEFIVD